MDARSLIELTLRRLRRDILEGRLGPGSRLAVAHLKSSYAVSGGTMREALSLLVSEGLAQAETQRGFRVAPMSLADMEDLTHTRVLVECQALRQSVRMGGEAWQLEVAATFRRLARIHPRAAKNPRIWFEQWERCNRDFHEALLSACPSQWSRRFRAVLYLHMERYRRLTANHPSPGRDVHAEHQALHDAALARDEKLCASLLKLHIEASLEAVRKHGLLPQSAGPSAVKRAFHSAIQAQIIGGIKT